MQLTLFIFRLYTTQGVSNDLLIPILEDLSLMRKGTNKQKIKAHSNEFFVGGKHKQL